MTGTTKFYIAAAIMVFTFGMAAVAWAMHGVGEASKCAEITKIVDGTPDNDQGKFYLKTLADDLCEMP